MGSCCDKDKPKVDPKGHSFTGGAQNQENPEAQSETLAQQPLQIPEKPSYQSPIQSPQEEDSPAKPSSQPSVQSPEKLFSQPPKMDANAIQLSEKLQPKQPSQLPKLDANAIQLSEKLQPKQSSQLPKLDENAVQLSEKLQPKQSSQLPKLDANAIRLSEKLQPKQSSQLPKLDANAIQLSEKLQPKQSSQPTMFDPIKESFPPAQSAQPQKCDTVESLEDSKPFRKAPSSNQVLEKPFEDVKSHFKIGRELGRGEFRVTKLCTEKSTGKQYACRSISKSSFVSENDEEGVRREVRIMQRLSGHPNIVQFKGAYEDKHCVHLVTELCAGGTLFDRFIGKGHYSERDAAFVFGGVVNVIDFCHSKEVIMYRNLRPENFLFSSNDEDAILKATDFRMSVFTDEGKVCSDTVGSAYYFAPEGYCGKEIDIWSAGVMLYMLLSGEPPFWAKTKKGIFDAVKKGNIPFRNQPWPTISRSAKDLISKMLTQDRKKLFTSKQVLEHQWIREGGGTSDNPIDVAVLSKLKQLVAMDRLMKLAQKVLAENLSWEEIQRLKSSFTDMVANGTITYDELKTGLARFSSKVKGAEFQQLMDAPDVDGNKTIDYIEFITATMHHKRLREERFIKILQDIDRDSSGFITGDELKAVMKQYEMSNDETMKEIICKVDIDKNAKINYEEIATLMKSCQPQHAKIF